MFMTQSGLTNLGEIADVVAEGQSAAEKISTLTKAFELFSQETARLEAAYGSTWILEHYIKRIRALEDIAHSFKGVEEAFAIQAGREVRIVVRPGDVDDLASLRLSRDVARKIEESMEYPGQIKVTVIRETRAVEYAK